jgi:hypothetical protein
MFSKGLFVLAFLYTCCVGAFSNGHFIERVVTLSGPSGATGSGVVLLDLDLVTMRIQLNYAGLTSTTTSAQLFAIPKANQTAIAAIPLTQFSVGTLNGTYDRTIDLALASSYTPTFLTAADTNMGQTVADGLEAIHDSVEGELAFLRINTTAFPNGELSGFLVAVPEPSSIALLVIVLSTFCGLHAWKILRKNSTSSVSCRCEV